MKITSKAWWKAAGIRALKTTLQTFLASVTITTLTRMDLIYAIISSVGAGLLSLINSVLVNLPEVEIEKPDDIMPAIEHEEIIDTSEEDSKLNGGGIGE